MATADYQAQIETAADALIGLIRDGEDVDHALDMVCAWATAEQLNDTIRDATERTPAALSAYEVRRLRESLVD